MSVDAIKTAIRLAEKTQRCLCIGGGEPTVHSQFWEVLGLALDSKIPRIWMGVNGKKTRRTLALLDMHSKDPRGRVKIMVSRDEWHDVIDPSIFEKCEQVGAEIRTNARVSKNGFAIANNLYNTTDCECPDLHIHVDGGVKVCACDDAPVLWNIYESDITEDAARCISVMGRRRGCHTHWTQKQKDIFYDRLHR